MKDEFVTCNVCSRSTCYKQFIDEHNYTMQCLNCGRTTNTYMVADSDLDKETFEKAPELYKDLRHVDANKLAWYPSTIAVPEKGMVFVDGTNKSNWRWASVRAVEIPKAELSKFPKGQSHKIDMSTIVHFGQDEFTMALEYIGFFSVGS